MICFDYYASASIVFTSTTMLVREYFVAVHLSFPAPDSYLLWRKRVGCLSTVQSGATSVKAVPFRLNPKLLLLFLIDVSWRVYVRASNTDGIAADVMKWRE